MPIYEFRCATCRNTFEQLMPMSARNPDCPHCHGKDVEKLFSAFGCSSGDGFSASVAGKGCGGCTSHNCGSCH